MYRELVAIETHEHHKRRNQKANCGCILLLSKAYLFVPTHKPKNHTHTWKTTFKFVKQKGFLTFINGSCVLLGGSFILGIKLEYATFLFVE